MDARIEVCVILEKSLYSDTVNRPDEGSIELSCDILVTKSPEALRMLRRFKRRSKRMENLRVRVLKQNLRRQLRQARVRLYHNYPFPRPVSHHIDMPRDKNQSTNNALARNTPNYDEIQAIPVELPDENMEVEEGIDAVTLITSGKFPVYNYRTLLSIFVRKFNAILLRI